MEYTQQEQNNFSNWAINGFENWNNTRADRQIALTREFFKTLSDDDINQLFKVGKRNHIELKTTDEQLSKKMKSFFTKAKKTLNLKPKKQEDKINCNEIFNSLYDFHYDTDTLKRVNFLINDIPTDKMTFQEVINKIFNGGYYSIPYGMSRTIEKNHNGEVLNAIFTKYGGIAIVKTKRKMIAVKLDTGSRNYITPIGDLREAINQIKEMRDEKWNMINIDDNTLTALKEKVEMDEVVRKI